MQLKPPFIHPRAIVEASIGMGTRVWANAHIMDGAIVGANCNIGEGVFIEKGAVVGDGCTIKNGVQLWDGVRLGDEVFVGPNATFTNVRRPRAFIKKERKEFLSTIVHTGTTIGANATILCGIEIGVYAFIAAASVVVKNVEPHALILGNPGRQVGRVCYCGENLMAEDFCASCQCTLSLYKPNTFMGKLDCRGGEKNVPVLKTQSD